MATATHGSCIVFPAEAFSARATLLAVQESRATALYGVPTMFLTELNLISAEPDFFQNSNARDKLSAGPSTLDRDEAVASLKSDPLGFSSLRTGIAAGSQIPSELMRKLHKTLNLTELTICYGMTETSPVSAMTTTDDPIEKRLNSVGRLLPHVSAKIIDPYDGSRVLAIGERGELVVSGYLVMQGYWREKEKTDEVLVKGEDGNMWMHVSGAYSNSSKPCCNSSGLNINLLDRRRSLHRFRWLRHHNRKIKRYNNPRRGKHPSPGYRKLPPISPGVRRDFRLRRS